MLLLLAARQKWAEAVESLHQLWHAKVSLLSVSPDLQVLATDLRHLSLQGGEAVRAAAHPLVLLRDLQQHDDKLASARVPASSQHFQEASSSAACRQASCDSLSASSGK